MRVRRSGGSRQKKDRPGTKVACLTIKLYRAEDILPALDINKPKIQCDQSNIIECGEGDVERAKMGGYQITMGSTPIVLFHVALLDSLEPPLELFDIE